MSDLDHLKKLVEACHDEAERTNDTVVSGAELDAYLLTIEPARSLAAKRDRLKAERDVAICERDLLLANAKNHLLIPEGKYLVWHQRQDGLWNAACACNATVCGVEFERRAAAEAAHFDLTIMERAHRAKNPERFAGNQIPACGPKLPEPNPNLPGPLVFP